MLLARFVSLGGIIGWRVVELPPSRAHGIWRTLPFFAAMKLGACLLSTVRGAILDEYALHDADRDILTPGVTHALNASGWGALKY